MFLLSFVFLNAGSEKGVEIYEELIAERASETGIEDLKGASMSGVALGRRIASRSTAVV